MNVKNEVFDNMVNMAEDELRKVEGLIRYNAILINEFADKQTVLKRQRVELIKLVNSFKKG